MKVLIGYISIFYFVASVYMQQQATQFSCEGRPSGYYADVQSGCQIYHMCDTLGRKFSYSCPNTTLFQQRMLICDHWYMVNCSKSETDFDVNLLIGQREKPFVEDNAYYRTPRPDLLAHPSVSEYNIIYRTGRAQEKNLVGTDQQSYFLPSHWSTQQNPTTPKIKALKTKKPYFVQPKEPQIFKSTFKATTPVYPKVAPTELPILESDDTRNQPKVVLLPPAPPKGANTLKFLENRNIVNVNFPSNFKATTPVYPQSVTPEVPLAQNEVIQGPTNVAYGLSSLLEPPKSSSYDLKTSQTTHGLENSVNSEQVVPEEKVHQNFRSSYKATTPVYPKFVTTEVPLAIEDTFVDPNNPSLSSVIQPPKNYDVNQLNTILQAPFYSNKAEQRQVKHEDNWSELRRVFLIPDYEFPLDISDTRRNYDQGPNSFQIQPNPVLLTK